jgi:hypothetical protein
MFNASKVVVLDRKSAHHCKPCGEDPFHLLLDAPQRVDAGCVLRIRGGDVRRSFPRRAASSASTFLSPGRLFDLDLQLVEQTACLAAPSEQLQFHELRGESGLSPDSITCPEAGSEFQFGDSRAPGQTNSRRMAFLYR